MVEASGFKNLSTLVQPATSAFPMRLYVQNRDPRPPQATSSDFRQFLQGDFWLNFNGGVTPVLWLLAYKTATFGNWIRVAGGSTDLESLSDTANTVVFPSTGADTPPDNIQLDSTTSALTIVSDPANHKIDFTVNTPFAPFSYVLVTTAMSPYTVTSTDLYIATDSTLGPITLNFPNAPATNRIFIIKDRFGQDAINNVLVTTPGGVVTFDGLTTYTMNSNYQAINLLFNATSYEVW